MMLTSRKPNSSTKNQYVTSLKSTAFADHTNCSLLGRAFKHNFGWNLDETAFKSSNTREIDVEALHGSTHGSHVQKRDKTAAITERVWDIRYLFYTVVYEISQGRNRKYFLRRVQTFI